MANKHNLNILKRLSMTALWLLLLLFVATGLPFSGLVVAVAEPVSSEQPETEPGETDASTVAVTDIELGDYKERMIVGETQDISATVLPTDASNQTVVFLSSDSGIVTVSSKGQLKAVSAGTVVVMIRADEVTKEISIEVRTETKTIEVNVNFLVLAPGETFVLKTVVLPDDAPQSLSYRSLDNVVAYVTESGIIQARDVGVTSVIVSNGDASATVTVLVNQRTVTGTNAADGTGTAAGPENHNDRAESSETAMIKKIESGESLIRVRQYDLPLVTSDILKALYNNRSTLILEHPAYTLTIVGERINNEQNQLFTSIAFEKNADNIEFVLNQGSRLPGEIEVELTDSSLNRRLLYLFNADKDIYQELNSKTGAILKLDEPGEYRLTDRQLNGLAIDPLWAAVVAVVILAGVVAFIIFRRRYWFW